MNPLPTPQALDPVASSTPAGRPPLRVGSGPVTLAGQPVGCRVVVGTPMLDRQRTRRLAELGLRDGTEVLVLHRTAGRGRVLALGDARIALDHSTLAGIPVLTAVEDPAREAGR